MRFKELTPFGLEVKKRLLELNMTQREFCEKYDIPPNRFSEILRGSIQNSKYKDRAAGVLGIKVSA